jgi:hypothetical protein
MGVTSTFQWFGQRVTDALLGDIDMRLRQAGEAVVAEARALAPVRTGALRSSIHYTVADRTLVIGVEVPWGVFQEFGTRFMRPHPYLRPALAAAGRVFGGSIEMDFASIGASSAAGWQGIHAVGAGFVVPSGIQPRPLTRAQHEHVRKHLMPVSKRLHRGNVARARLRVRHR